MGDVSVAFLTLVQHVGAGARPVPSSYTRRHWRRICHGGDRRWNLELGQGCSQLASRGATAWLDSVCACQGACPGRCAFRPSKTCTDVLFSACAFFLSASAPFFAAMCELALHERHVCACIHR